jgi:hypothetical protein
MTTATLVQANTLAPSLSRKRLAIGWILCILPVLMLLMSAFMKVAQPPEVVEGFEHLGWSMDKALTLAIIEIACTSIFLIPRTAVLGAILLAGYLGGASATHMRVGDPFIMPIVLGMVLWLGLFLREPRLSALVPLRR